MSNNIEATGVPPSAATVAGALSALHPPVAAAAAPELSLETLTVDVICPSRLGHGHSQGFAVAPFPIRVPSAALDSLDGVFAALKLGALADESETLEFLHSVGAQEWVLPQNGVVFAQERPSGPGGRFRWTALTSAAALIRSEPLVVCGVREWRQIKSLEANEEKADILHKRKLEARGILPDADHFSNGAGIGKAAKAGTGLSPSNVLRESMPGAGGNATAVAFHELAPSTLSPDRNITSPPSSVVSHLLGGPSLVATTASHSLPSSIEQQQPHGHGDGGNNAGVNLSMGLVNVPHPGNDDSDSINNINSGDDNNGNNNNNNDIDCGVVPPIAVSSPLPTPSSHGFALGPAMVAARGMIMGHGGEGVGVIQDMSEGVAAAEVGVGSPGVSTAGGGEDSRGGIVEQQNSTCKKAASARKRMHKVHGPAFCKMFQMLRIRFIPQGSATTLRDNSHIVMGYAAKGEEFGCLSNKAATVKMKDVPWTDPGFMGLLAAAGGGALSTVKLPERAQRVFARMMSSESMRVALMWHCAEACARLCTYGSVYKDKKGQPFDSLAKAFLEEFRLPPHSFPASQEEALSVLRLPSLHCSPPPAPLPPPAPPDAIVDVEQRVP